MSLDAQKAIDQFVATFGKREDNPHEVWGWDAKRVGYLVARQHCAAELEERDQRIAELEDKAERAQYNEDITARKLYRLITEHEAQLNAVRSGEVVAWSVESPLPNPVWNNGRPSNDTVAFYGARLRLAYACPLASPPAAQVPDVETAWLVERAGPHYVCIDDSGWSGWTNDHLEALRFARRNDADRYAGSIEIYDCKAVEHQWLAAAPTHEATKLPEVRG